MKKFRFAVLLLFILQLSLHSQSLPGRSVIDYLPCKTGNCWVSKGLLNPTDLFGFYVLDQFKNDSLAFTFVVGLANFSHPDQPCSGCNTWMTIQLAPPDTIYRGPFIEYDPEQLNRSFNRTGIFITLSDTSRIISVDSTIVCPLGTFHHCMVLKPWGAFAPGFGPVGPNYVYAKVNGIEYGSKPQRGESPESYTVHDYFPATPGNIWVTQIAADRGSRNYFALKVIQQYEHDSTRFCVGSGPSDKYRMNDPMDFSFNWWEIRFESSQLICQGLFVTPERPFLSLGKWLDLSDTTKLISLDSTVTCPCGTFENCIVDQYGGIWAPGFGPVYTNLVYAKVNGIEYGTMPSPSAVESDRPQITPRENALYPAYPNPFNQSTGISFYLTKPGPVRLTIFDTQGRTVRVLLNGQAASGSHYLTWDGMTDGQLPCPSGVYHVVLNSAWCFKNQALTLIR